MSDRTTTTTTTTITDDITVALTPSPRYLMVLLSLYVIELTALGIHPYQRTVWLTENLIAVLIVSALAGLYFLKVRFSNVAYTLAAVFVYLQTIGGHYTFELVPFDWVTEFFGFTRNNFDRMCHFLVGVFAYPMLEYVESRKILTRRGWAIFFVVMGVFGVAAIFELVEWIYAELADPAAGSAFLGSQGDIWDAQKDMLADGLGALVTAALYCLCHRRRRPRFEA